MMATSQKTLDTYLELCTEWYDLCKTTPPEDAYAFYRSYIEKATGPVLEPMCGTGRFSLAFLKEGFDIHGFDASKHMLGSLQKQAKRKNLKPTVWKGFIEHLAKPKVLYSLIFIPTCSFCLIIDLKQVTTTLKSLYDHLKKDGILLFEVETLHAIPKKLDVWQGSVHHKTDQKLLITSFLDSMLGDNVRSRISKYESVDRSKIIATQAEEYKLRLYEPEVLLQLLKETGFREVRILKRFDKIRRPEINDEMVVYECTK